MRVYSKILGINKKEQYHSFSFLLDYPGFAYLDHLVHVQCQVHSKDTLTKATQ